MSYADWVTLRELDEALGCGKGTAFRAFRRLTEREEGRDFLVLHHERDAAAIEALRASGRIYPSTVNLVLLSRSLADAVQAQMRRMMTDPAE